MKLKLLILIFSCVAFVACKRNNSSSGNLSATESLSQPSRDSLIINLYLQGRISRDSLFRSIYRKDADYAHHLSGLSKEKRIAEESRLIQVLRNHARHRFALEYLLQRVDSTKYDSLALHHAFPSLIHINDPQALEAYELEFVYALYRYKSFDGKTPYYILVERCPEVTDFMVFDPDTAHPKIIDSYQPYRNGGFSFDTLNGGNIVKVTYSTGGTGQSTECLRIVGIEGGRLKPLFECVLSDISFYNNTTTSTTSNLKYVDLNGDGYLDIQFEQVMNTSKRSKNATLVSRKVSEFMWDNQAHTFTGWR